MIRLGSELAAESLLECVSIGSIQAAVFESSVTDVFFN